MKKLSLFIASLFLATITNAQIINPPTINLTGPITSVGNVTSIASQTGTGTKFVVDNSPTIITPTFSGTAAGNISGNAATVTTNANLTGPITSTGNATSIASQTGTGTKFVVDTSPTLVTPILGVATATSINKVAITAPASSATLTIADGKTASINNTLTFTGTDSSSVNFGTGGTVAYITNGTWTGTLTSATGSITAGNTAGTYTKIGNTVFVTGDFDASSVSSPSGTLTLTGLPFTSGNNNRNYSAFSIRVSNTNATGASVTWQAYVPSNSTTVTIEYLDTNSGNVGTNAAGQVKANTSYFISGFYMTN